MKKVYIVLEVQGTADFWPDYKHKAPGYNWGVLNETPPGHVYVIAVFNNLAAAKAECEALAADYEHGYYISIEEVEE